MTRKGNTVRHRHKPDNLSHGMQKKEKEEQEEKAEDKEILLCLDFIASNNVNKVH